VAQFSTVPSQQLKNRCFLDVMLGKMVMSSRKFKILHTCMSQEEEFNEYKTSF